MRNLWKGALSLMAVLALVACSGGGGGGGDDTPKTDGPVVKSLTGVVADGYLVNATVFLDKNNNKILDAGEPFTTTGAGGKYELKYELTEDEKGKNYPVVVIADPAETIDEDTGTKVEKEYLLTTPIGKESFISPMTTLVARAVEEGASSADAAATTLTTAMGTTSDLFADYVAAKDTELHEVAKIVADLFGEGKEALDTTAGDDADVLISGTIALIADEIIVNLASVATAVEDGDTTSVETAITTSLESKDLADIVSEADTDGDGTVNSVDTDDDNDGLKDAEEAIKGTNPLVVDTDADGVNDKEDAFPLNSAETIDTDNDGIGNNTDTDDDGDGVADSLDAFPLDSAETLDTDSDGTGNNADTDDDGDTVLDTEDAFPLDATETVDTDSDGTGNNADTDDDGDGVADISDVFPLNAAEAYDTDSDGTGNNADTDDDNDGVADSSDAFPLDATESVDTDGDGIGNNTDTDDDGDGILDVDDEDPLVPDCTSFEEPFNLGMTAFKDGLIAEASTGNAHIPTLLEAAQNFQRAAACAQTSTTNAADVARFYGALSRVMAVALDTRSDGSDDGLNDVNDALDAFGVPTSDTERDYDDTIDLPQTCTDVVDPYTGLVIDQDCIFNDLPSTTPSSGEVLDLVDALTRTNLEAAIAELDKISSTYQNTFTSPVDGELEDQDYGDVLFLKAIANGLLGQLAFVGAYDLDLDIALTANAAKAGTLTTQQVLDANPNLGELDASVYAAQLAEAKENLRTGMETLDAAIVEIEAETDDQLDDIFSLIETDWVYNESTMMWEEVDVTAEAIAEVRDGIAMALTGLDEPVTVDDNNTPDDITDDFILDVSQLFAGIDFRSLLPGFSGDEATGLFPDPTMGGVIVQAPDEFVNKDRDGNGIPDELEDGNFYPALLNDRYYSVNYWFGDSQENWNFEFLSDGTFEASWNKTVYSPTWSSTSDYADGDWTIQPDGTLLLDGFSGAPAGLNSILFELNWDGSDSADWPEIDVEAAFNYSSGTKYSQNWWHLYHPVGYEIGTTDLAVDMSWYYIQTRNDEWRTGPVTTSWVEFTMPELDDRHAENWMVHDLELTDGTGDVVADFYDYDFSKSTYVTYNCETGTCEVTAEDSVSTGYFTRPDYVVQNETYTFTAKAANGDVITKTFASPAATVVPHIHASSVTPTWETDGSLTISWTNPTGETNWSLISQIRIIMWSETEKELSVRATAAMTSVNIPASVLALVDVDESTGTVFRMQTRAYKDGVNYARGQSDEIVLSAPVSGFTVEMLTNHGQNMNNSFYFNYDDTSSPETLEEVAFMGDGTAGSFVDGYYLSWSVPTIGDPGWVNNDGMFFNTWQLSPSGGLEIWDEMGTSLEMVCDLLAENADGLTVSCEDLSGGGVDVMTWVYAAPTP